MRCWWYLESRWFLNSQYFFLKNRPLTMWYTRFNQKHILFLFIDKISMFSSHTSKLLSGIPDPSLTTHATSTHLPFLFTTSSAILTCCWAGEVPNMTRDSEWLTESSAISDWCWWPCRHVAIRCLTIRRHWHGQCYISYADQVRVEYFLWRITSWRRVGELMKPTTCHFFSSKPIFETRNNLFHRKANNF